MYFSVYHTNPAPYTKIIRDNNTQNVFAINELIKAYDIAFSGNASGCEITIQHKQHTQYLSVYVMPVFEEASHFINEISVMAIDITDRVSVYQELKENEKKLNISLKEKEMLLKELHHRVKNNLQVIGSIMNLQTRLLSEESAKQIINETKNRINSIALVHDNLYKSKNLDFLNLNIYLKDIFNNLVGSLLSDPENTELNFECDDILLNTETAVPLGIIFNELITNSIKHGLKNSHSRRMLSVKVKSENNIVTLSVCDSGSGLKENYFKDEKINEVKSLGMMLVRDLAYQIGAEIEVNNIPGKFNIILTFNNHYEYGRN